MNSADLDYIFSAQIAEGTDKLYFMIIDGDSTPTVLRHTAADIDGLLPMMCNMVYDGADGRMPRFRTQQ